MNKTSTRTWPSYQTIWRWHFYAGLFCIPFFILLSITGALYLFKPQVEAALDRPYDTLQIDQPQPPSRQVEAALTAVPGMRLNAYELPDGPHSAARVLVGQGDDLKRVYVHPQTLEILKIEEEDWKFMRVIHRLHGNLLIGDRGSDLVELAASWGIIMIITGLFLWWPRSSNGMAGILYPHVGRGGRLQWRDLHAVTGFWISFFTLFLLLSGMPWTKSWGGLLKEIRHWNVGHTVQQDWTTGRSSELAERRQANSDSNDEHAHHHHGKMSPSANNYTPLDRLVEVVKPLSLAVPVQISPPSRRSPDWMARSLAQNRPLRTDLVLDAATGSIKSRKNFSDRALLDRIIGIGVAAHEGQLFGWFNQLLGVLTALGLVLLSWSAIVLWWRRRNPGTLGAPPAKLQAPVAIGLLILVVALGILLPFLGLSLSLVLLLERLLFRQIPQVRDFLGLAV